MAVKSYVIVKECKAPIIRATGRPDKPQEIQFRKFRRGEIVKGELKHANNEPAFILVNGVMVINLDCVKELVTKEVVSSANGQDVKVPKALAPTKNQKLRYIDAMVIGGLAGIGGVFLAEKQGWIAQPDKKNKLYGAIGGVLAGLYLAYRLKQNSVVKPKEE